MRGDCTREDAMMLARMLDEGWRRLQARIEYRRQETRINAWFRGGTI